MNDDNTNPAAPINREEMMAALFANMVLQQTNFAMMFLGRVPHPETGEHTRDLDMAQMFIDQLEMLEAKTKNNLSKQEEGLLRQSLTAVHMAYVEAANEGPSSKAESPGKAAPLPEKEADSASAPSGESEDTRKKFTKKY